MGDAAPAGALRAIVRRARAGLAAARAAEALCFGAGALALALAAAAWDGADLARRDAWAAALCAGALCAASFALEHRATERDVARRLDRRLGEGGALLTAFEVERQGEGGAVAVLLLARVRARLSTRAALRAVLPSFALAGAAPLFGAAALAAALELGRAQPPPPPAGAAQGLVASLAALAGAGDASGPAAGDGAAAALAEARSLAADLTAGGGPQPAALPARVEQLDRRLQRLGADGAPAPEQRRALAAARSWLDAVRQSLPPAGEGAAEGSAPGAGSAPMTSAPRDGTMAGSTPPAGGGGAPPDGGGAPPAGADGGPPPGGAVEAGTAAGAWWPARHDEVVRRWLERTRGAGR